MRRDDRLATGRRFPPEYRRVALDQMIAEVGDQEFGWNQIRLATAVQGTVLVQWWLLVPAAVDGVDVKPEPGKVMFDVSLKYSDFRLYDKYQPGKKVVDYINLLAVLDAPSRQNPLSRAELAARVYRDLASLEPSASISMVYGRKTETSGARRGKEVTVSTSPSETTEKEYADHLAAYLNTIEHAWNNRILRALEGVRTKNQSQLPSEGGSKR